ncbi:MAG: hypothetical protein KDA70_15100 [Planctomycetaceae bacterium]|nr:hypothetical protein [Planctomycetaceae bacterium]
MFYDQYMVHFYLVFLMVNDAIQKTAKYIVLTRKEDHFSVVYISSETEFERDQIPVEQWDSTLLVLRYLARETSRYASTKESNCSIADSTVTEFNSILFSDMFPEIENRYLTELRETSALPLHLDLSFTDRVVTITINQQKQ